MSEKQIHSQQRPRAYSTVQCTCIRGAGYFRLAALRALSGTDGEHILGRGGELT